jgi:ASCH domain.
VRAITLTQPYATLIAIGAKHIETRSWATSYRGPLAIHAGKGLSPVGGRAGLYDLAFSDPDGYFYPALHQTNVFCIDDLPRGAIVATCDLVDCVPTTYVKTVKVLHYERQKLQWLWTVEEKAFGDYADGRWAWLLANITPLAEPIPARGALSLWTWDGAL